MAETVPAWWGLGLVLLAVASVTLASLWENLRDGRSPRQRRGGIFHRLLAKVSGWLVRVSVWWILRVVNPPADASYDLAWSVGRKLWPKYVEQVADFVQVWLVPTLMLDFLAWPFAYGYLRAKAEREKGQP